MFAASETSCRHCKGEFLRPLIHQTRCANCVRRVHLIFPTKKSWTLRVLRCANEVCNNKRANGMKTSQNRIYSSKITVCKDWALALSYALVSTKHVTKVRIVLALDQTCTVSSSPPDTTQPLGRHATSQRRSGRYSVMMCEYHL